MARKTRIFTVKKKKVVAFEAEGAADLKACLQEIQLDIQKENVASYQQPSSLLSQLFRSTPKKPVENSNNNRFILYTTPNLTPGFVANDHPPQRALIVTNGKDHYYYDLLKGGSVEPFKDVLTGLGITTDPKKWAGNVSGAESEKIFRNCMGDFLLARRISKANLPDDDLDAAVTHAIEQIYNTINSQNQKELAPAKMRTVGPGGIAR